VPDDGYRRTSVGPPRPTGAARVDGLDGIRGLAVAAVVAYHLGFGWARGGYLGVDTFLVLSGYLITSGLLHEHRVSGHVRLGAFWARRARRLLPALIVVTVAAAIYAATMALPDEAHGLRLDALSELGFFSNWRFIATSQGYFGQAAAPSLLRHTWSLAVEGQLYLMWPLVAIGVVRRWGGTALLAVALVLASASAGLAMALAHGGNVTRAYYGTDTRAAAFLVGGALAVVVATRPSWPRRTGSVGLAGAAGAVGLAATVVLWTTLSGTSVWLFRGGLVLAAIATAAVVADVVAHPGGPAGRMLSLRPLRLVGRVSYGIYLWHWPLVLVLDHRRTGLSGVSLLALRLAALAAATAASWVLVERPALRAAPRVRIPMRRLVAVSGCVAVAGGLLVPLAASPARARTAPIPAPSAAPLVPAVILGDSVAVTLGNGLLPLAPGYHVRLANGAIVGCGVAVGTALRSVGQESAIPSRCLTWEQQWRSSIDANQAAVAIILLGRWELLDRLVDGRWQHVGQPGFDRYLDGRLDLAIATGQRHGVTVVLCTVPYFGGVERPQGGIWPENDPARVDRFNQLVRQAASRHPGIVLFDLNALVSPDNRYASVIAGVPVRSSDGVHFTKDGAAYVADRLLPIVARAPTSPGSRGSGG
jgi:peptidoglycan/LPS O-acetylase OafA/YrhL